MEKAIEEENKSLYDKLKDNISAEKIIEDSKIPYIDEIKKITAKTLDEKNIYK